MIIHYLKIAWRNIWNDKLYSLINLIGLTIVFAVVFLFVQWMRFELSFENIYPDGDRIYQIQEAEKRADGVHKSMYMRPNMSEEMEEKYPMIEEAVFFTSFSNSSIVLNEQPFLCRVSDAKPNFLNVFPMECIAGTTSNVGKSSVSAFISEEFAKKVFGDPEKAVGVTFDLFLEQRTFEGVLRVPKNSFLQFDILFLADAIYDRGVHFIKLKEDVPFSEQQQRLMANFLTERDGSQNKLILEPIKNIHLRTDNRTTKVEITDSYYGSISEIRTFAVVVFLLLVLAIINYVNTSTARAMSRAREVGVRKISGSSRRHLVFRFLTEAFLISFAATFLAMDIAKLLHHPFEGIMNNTFPFHINGFTILMALVMCLATSVLAGGYAAFYLSSLNPVNVLSGDTGKGSTKNRYRKILLGLQFGIAIGILICTWMVYRQLDYILNEDLGFDKENVYYFNTNLLYESEDFINELQRNPYVINATMASSAPYNVDWAYSGVDWYESTRGETEMSFAELACDHRFDDVFGLTMMQGEFIPPGLTWWQDATDKSFDIVINETFKELIGIENPVGTTITYGKNWKKEGKVIGVIKDFYFRPMNYEISPLIIAYDPESTVRMYIKIDPAHEKEALQHVRATYDKMRANIVLLSTRPFVLTPLEKEYREMYRSETRLQQILGIFSLLSIILSFMGIVSMVAFIIEKRTKEIGIRKINGAKWMDIVQEFWNEFLLLLGIAAIPAVLVSYWFMHGWVQQYVYRPAFGWWVFILVPLFIAGLTVLILFWQVRSIAKRDPVESLRAY